MRLRRLRYIIFTFLLPAFFFLPGCGKKTPPVPPQTLLPKPITNLRPHLDEKGVTLSWTVPKFNEDGALVSEIAGFEVAAHRNDLELNRSSLQYF